MRTRRMTSRERRGTRGSAFMEFFFALPFLLFIMVLSMNFCKAYLMQQRAMIAARYTAWADVQRQQLPSSVELSQKFFGGEPVTVSSGDMGLNGDQQKDLGGILQAVLTPISGTTQYRVQYHYKPIFAAGDYFGNGRTNWYPDIQINGQISTDSKDWHYPDLTIGKLLADTLGIIGKLL